MVCVTGPRPCNASAQTNTVVFIALQLTHWVAGPRYRPACAARRGFCHQNVATPALLRIGTDATELEPHPRPKRMPSALPSGCHTHPTPALHNALPLPHLHAQRVALELRRQLRQLVSQQRLGVLRLPQPGAGWNRNG